MLDLILSTAAFFAASYGLKRFLDNQDVAPGRTRSILILVLATAASFAVSALVTRFDHEPSFDSQILHALPRPGQ
ncbi:MAG TPA: hypothetical protein VFN66_07095 [Burkholderiales bacterium]|nr:hypothetical protein [Burkholderiales bacterium]